ncbi:MAG: hypothetical protein J7623_18565 [Chitinophaga sp.]|uniref:glycine-rich domain-containing protein n=1 Tax=Chitinophaga sp. TaxID=1869181 RepID=UPI001AFE2006|nr:hypothetical protein [Chitinophaga sp.]MBO9730653.1 hypothetical protein [Chitinophaga sp.]
MIKNNEFVALSPGTLLWQQIDAFRMDDPDAVIPFSKKLARENQWDKGFTQKAIQEYKRFIYLCCISPTGASPSPIVDKVWHQHLLYTQNYWEEFCEKTLQRKIHHYPSSGGVAEKQKYLAWEDDTRQQYRRYFGEDPPADYWPCNTPPAVVKRRSLFRKSWLTFLFFLFSFFLFPGCSNDSAPFGVIIMIVFWGFVIARAINRDDKPGQKSQSDSSSGGSCGSSCSSGSSCGSSCGSGCGGGCGGCGS